MYLLIPVRIFTLSSSLSNCESETALKGVLDGYDLHLNLVLSGVEELNKDLSVKNTLGEILVRGDNVVYISPTVQRAAEKGEGTGKSKVKGKGKGKGIGKESGEKDTW